MSNLKMVLNVEKSLETTIQKNLPKSQKFAKKISVEEFRHSQPIFGGFSVILFHSNLDKNVTRNKHKLTSDQQNVTSNEQKVTSNEQKVPSNEQKVTSNEQKVTSNEQKVQPPEMNTLSLLVYWYYPEIFIV